MDTETVCIPREEYILLKRKEVVANDVLLQLESSLEDLGKGKLRRVR
ncbi:hypothetical protein HY483_02360 [Candidatus Woesearchaeota archaeon]|nr:hypothetical protein [Candidatus Woesearchaeota archaeon]